MTASGCSRSSRWERTAARPRPLRGACTGDSGSAPVLAFERRDWERLEDFASAGSLHMRAAEPVKVAPIPPEKVTQRSLVDPDATLQTEVPAVPARKPPPSFSHWKKSDPLAQGPSARVLLVDDDRDIREVVGAMLDAVGLAVEGGHERGGGARARARDAASISSSSTGTFRG